MKPTGADLWLIYTCNKCGQEHQATIKETRFPGGVLCCCNNRIVFDPIQKVKINVNYLSPHHKKLNQIVKENKLGKVYHAGAVQSLKKLGWSEKYIFQKYKEVYDNIPDPTNPESIIEYLIKVL